MAMDRFDLMLALATGFALSKRHARLMAAESCTGGLVNHWLTTIAGSSHWFDGGVISYSNAVKITFLGVHPSTLRVHGAVSRQTAHEMADGMRRNHRKALAEPLSHVPDALYALSITGIAGPQGASLDKPIGLVHFGWAGPAGVETAQARFQGSRAEIQSQAARFSLAGLFQRLCRPLG